jgi:hypothetical protein
MSRSASKANAQERSAPHLISWLISYGAVWPPKPEGNAVHVVMNAEEVPGGVPSTLSAGWASGFYITRTLAPAPGLPPPRCVNDDAVWVLSSAKPGNGIPQLLNDNVRGPIPAC